MQVKEAVPVPRAPRVFSDRQLLERPHKAEGKEMSPPHRFFRRSGETGGVAPSSGCAPKF